MKCDQDLCLNLWYGLNKLLWQEELNPRVRCAFGNVLIFAPICPFYSFGAKLLLWCHIVVFFYIDAKYLNSKLDECQYVMQSSDWQRWYIFENSPLIMLFFYVALLYLPYEQLPFTNAGKKLWSGIKRFNWLQPAQLPNGNPMWWLRSVLTSATDAAAFSLKSYSQIHINEDICKEGFGVR